MPKISVIVPIYNAEKYLHQCIDSIIAQTFSDFELLLIDDGSSDSSGFICEEYAQKDFRIKVFHKRNGGVSSARNLGLDNAKGEWITFVDSDDWIKKDYLYSMIRQSDADMIMSSFEVIDNFEKWDNQIEHYLYKKNKIKYFIERYVSTATMCAPWCKLFKNSIIDTLRFNTEISFWEDTIFVFEYLNKIDSIRTVENNAYQYRRGLCNSLSVKQLSIQKYLYMMQTYSKCLKLIEDRFEYDGTNVRIYSKFTIFGKCLSVIQNNDTSFHNKYQEFIKLINDENINEIFHYDVKYMKGKKRRFFDFMVLNKLYFLLFIYVINYKGFIY